MSKALKIDLHTHPVSALKNQMGIKGIGDINKDVAAEIVKAVKNAGMNGIAITEKNNFNHGWVACLQIMDLFKSERIIILPGIEIDLNNLQLLQLYIPNIYRKRLPFFKEKEWFWILTHPGLDGPMDMNIIKDLRIDAVEGKSLKGEFSLASQVSRERNIPIIQASDSNTLAEIGSYYLEL